MRFLSLRTALIPILVAALVACGGGGAGGGGATFGFAGGTSAPAGGAGSAVGPTGAGSSVALPGAGDGAGEGGAGGISSPGSSGDAPAPGGAGTSASAGVAGSGDDGIGSGGTGIGTADAVGVGSVDGLGSIILNGLRYDTERAELRLLDAPSLQIGMSARVIGSIDEAFTAGVARRIESAAELRGPASGIDLAAGSFAILGTTVTTDPSTVWGDVVGLAAIANGSTLQVWGLPDAPGMLRATRIERRPTASAPVVTGIVQRLDAARRSFSLGGLTIDYGGAAPAGFALTDGIIVRVRADRLPLAGILDASLVQRWNAVPQANGFKLQLAGVVTDFAALSAFRVLGIAVDGASASVAGGPSRAIGNGVKVEVDGVYADGVLAAAKIRIKHLPGGGGRSSFEVNGPIGSFDSPSSFKVRGQSVNAGDPAVVFDNGTAADLRNGIRVDVLGSRIVDGVLIAERVRFE